MKAYDFMVDFLISVIIGLLIISLIHFISTRFRKQIFFLNTLRARLKERS